MDDKIALFFVHSPKYEHITIFYLIERNFFYD